jgi:hypothetical protein
MRIVPGPPPTLPTTVEGWLGVRQGHEPSFSDLLEQVHLSAVKRLNGDYTGLLTARVNKEAVHGAVIFDQAAAVAILQEEASRMGIEAVAVSSRARISRSLNIMRAKRFGNSRPLMIKAAVAAAQQAATDPQIGEGE